MARVVAIWPAAPGRLIAGLPKSMGFVLAAHTAIVGAVAPTYGIAFG